MKLFLEYNFSDQKTICFLFQMGITITVCMMLLYVLDYYSVFIGIICSAIVLPRNKFLPKMMDDDSISKPQRNLLLCIVFFILLLTFMLIPFFTDLYLHNKDFYYIWVFSVAILYFTGVIYFMLNKICNVLHIKS